jgi:hypothetical protein
MTAFLASAQEPAGKKQAANSAEAERFVARMMEFNKKKDGKLTKDEITDERLRDLFDRADANKDGVVTREELLALFAQEAPQGGGRGGPGGGPGGRGGFGPGGPGGPGGPPQPGQILPSFMQEMLKLTVEQKKQVADLQKDVDAKLEKILTADQKKQLKEMRDRGPGGFGPGGPGGRGGRPGGPGGPGGGRPGAPGGPGGDKNPQ